MLEGKIVMVTGASRGIGKSIATVFAKQKATLIITGRNSEKLILFKNQLTSDFGASVHILEYDVSSLEEIKKNFMWIKKTFGHLDVLVNNAGIMEDSLLGMVSESHVKNIFSTNVESVIYHMQFASRLMMKKRQGSIINISSIVGRYGSAGQAVYSSSKAAVIGATYSAAKELGAYNIRVNAVAPGIIDTDLVDHLNEEDYKKQIALGRFGKPEEVANVVEFLASENASYLTGQVIGIDGGLVV
ncbi:SDR family NAD(P)-dependent oxidoreductase [Solibacillus silvestris]